MMTLIMARRLASEAFAEAERRAIVNISVVVTDAANSVFVAMRADSQGAFGIDTARAKARSALGFGYSTKKLSAIFGGQPAATAGIDAAIGGGFIPIGGAVVVTDDTGLVIGAASISGGTPDDDDAIVRIAVSNCKLFALD